MATLTPLFRVRADGRGIRGPPLRTFVRVGAPVTKLYLLTLFSLAPLSQRHTLGVLSLDSTPLNFVYYVAACANCWNPSR